MTNENGVEASADEYDYGQQVRDLVSSDPSVKQAAVNKLRLRVEKIRQAGTETRRVVVIKRTVSVVTVSPVRNWMHAGAGGGHRQMSDKEIIAWEQGLSKEDKVLRLEEEIAYAKSPDDIVVETTYEFLDEPIEVKR